MRKGYLLLLYLPALLGLIAPRYVGENTDLTEGTTLQMNHSYINKLRKVEFSNAVSTGASMGFGTISSSKTLIIENRVGGIQITGTAIASSFMDDYIDKVVIFYSSTTKHGSVVQFRGKAVGFSP